MLGVSPSDVASVVLSQLLPQEATTQIHVAGFQLTMAAIGLVCCCLQILWPVKLESLMSIRQTLRLPPHEELLTCNSNLCRPCACGIHLLYLLLASDALPLGSTLDAASRALCSSVRSPDQPHLQRAWQLLHAGKSAQLRMGPCNLRGHDPDHGTPVRHGPVHCVSLRASTSQYNGKPNELPKAVIGCWEAWIDDIMSS